MVQRAQKRPSKMEGYTDEVTLPNGHTWRKNRAGRWCRFSGGGTCFLGTKTPKSGGTTDPEVQAGKKQLTPEQQKAFKDRIQKAGGNTPEADNIRYERHVTQRKLNGEDPMPRWNGKEETWAKSWDAANHRLKQNRLRGAEQETAGRTGLGEHLGKEGGLVDNNAGTPVTHTTDSGVTTRPDSIGHTADGKIDVVHDHKHLMGGKDQVVYNTEQLRAQHDLAMNGAKSGGTVTDPVISGGAKHKITLSSDAPDIKGVPPKPRPSRNLGSQENTEILFTNKSGKVLYKWNPEKQIWVDV